MSRSLYVTAPAKVNLHLAVGQARPDGFHDVTGVFHVLELADVLEVVEAERFSFSCSVDLGVADSENLVVRAVRAMEQAFSLPARVSIHLIKRIPHGAGLGGGSSDAAGAIAALAHVWGARRDDPRCLAVAASIGSDVPFFLLADAALMAGRGDELTRILPPLSVPLVVAKPLESVPTPLAYRTFDSDPVAPASPAPVVEALVAGDVRALAGALANNLEPASVSLVPEIGRVLHELGASRGVLGARMSGSGSAVFALCENDAVAFELAEQCSRRDVWAVATALATSGLRVVEGADA